MPPENEGGYKLDYSAMPEGVKISPDGEKALLKSLHAAGMTNKQVQTVINKYAEAVKAGLEIQGQQATQKAGEVAATVEAELKTAWGADHDANVAAAQRGFNHLADDADRADIKKIGVDQGATYRILMKVLAKVGAGISEDVQVNLGESAVLNADLSVLMKSEAYLKADHPEHEATVAKVTALYNKLNPSRKK